MTADDSLLLMDRSTPQSLASMEDQMEVMQASNPAPIQHILRPLRLGCPGGLLLGKA